MSVEKPGGSYQLADCVDFFQRKKYMVKRMGRRKLRRGVRKPRTTWRPRARQARVYSQTYTEVLQAGDVQTNTGGVFLCRFMDIPQNASYSNLYKQFCIKKLQVMLLPKFTEYTAGAPAANFLQVPRLVYSVDDTPGLQAPTNEISVLTDNGAKVLSMKNKITLTCYPKPNIASIDLAATAAVATRQRKAVWLNTQSGDVTNSGETVQHGGIRYYISGNPLFNEYQYDVYYKITFQMRDPA